MNIDFSSTASSSCWTKRTAITLFVRKFSIYNFVFSGGSKQIIVNLSTFRFAVAPTVSSISSIPACCPLVENNGHALIYRAEDRYVHLDWCKSIAPGSLGQERKTHFCYENTYFHRVILSSNIIKTNAVITWVCFAITWFLTRRQWGYCVPRYVKHHFNFLPIQLIFCSKSKTLQRNKGLHASFF